MVINVAVFSVIVATLVATVAVSPVLKLTVAAVPWLTPALCIVSELAVLTAYPPMKKFVAVIIPPTYSPPPTPTPPVTTNAPVVVELTAVLLVV